MSLPEDIESLSRELWTRVWSKDQDIACPDSLKEACASCGISKEKTNKLVDSISDQEVKDELRRTTDEALSYGSFGTPTILIYKTDGQHQMFFGSDRFELIAHILGVQWQGPHPSRL
jgi:glutathione S-transferase kappa 1